MFKARRIAKMHPNVVNAIVKLLKALNRELLPGKDVEISPEEEASLNATEWSRKGLRLVRREHDSIPDESELEPVPKKAKGETKAAAQP